MRQIFLYREAERLVGWLADYPDHRTQGETLGELEVNLSEIFSELSSGQIPSAHHAGEQE